MQSEFKVASESASSHPRQMQSGTAHITDTQSMVAHGADSAHHCLADLFDVIGSKSHNAVMESGIISNMHANSVHERSVSTDCGEHFVAVRIENDANYWDLLRIIHTTRMDIIGYADRYNTQRKAVHVVGCSIKGINDPNPLFVRNGIDRLWKYKEEETYFQVVTPLNVLLSQKYMIRILFSHISVT